MRKAKNEEKTETETETETKNEMVQNMGKTKRVIDKVEEAALGYILDNSKGELAGYMGAQKRDNPKFYYGRLLEATKTMPVGESNMSLHQKIMGTRRSRAVLKNEGWITGREERFIEPAIYPVSAQIKSDMKRQAYALARFSEKKGLMNTFRTYIQGINLNNGIKGQGEFISHLSNMGQRAAGQFNTSVTALLRPIYGDTPLIRPSIESKLMRMMRMEPLTNLAHNWQEELRTSDAPFVADGGTINSSAHLDSVKQYKANIFSMTNTLEVSKVVQREYDLTQDNVNFDNHVKSMNIELDKAIDQALAEDGQSKLTNAFYSIPYLCSDTVHNALTGVTDTKIYDIVRNTSRLMEGEVIYMDGKVKASGKHQLLDLDVGRMLLNKVAQNRSNIPEEGGMMFWLTDPITATYIASLRDANTRYKGGEEKGWFINKETGQWEQGRNFGGIVSDFLELPVVQTSYLDRRSFYVDSSSNPINETGVKHGGPVYLVDTAAFAFHMDPRITNDSDNPAINQALIDRKVITQMGALKPYNCSALGMIEGVGIPEKFANYA